MKKFLCLVLSIILVLSLSACDSSDYKKAMELYESGDLDGAITAFSVLGDYEDSADMVLKIKYEKAGQYYKDEYYDALVDDINQYMEEGKIISRVIIDKASDVIYSTVDDTKYASINCIYYLKTSDTTEKITETYILRKDGEGRWKILGWKLYEEKEE